MKPFAYYSKPRAECPRKGDFTVIYAYRNGAVVWRGSGDEWATAKSNVTWSVVEEVVDEDAFRRARNEYYSEIARLSMEFKADLFEEHGVTGHPKAEKVYSLAYDYGHAAGYEDVASHFSSLVDLIKD